MFYLQKQYIGSAKATSVVFSFFWAVKAYSYVTMFSQLLLGLSSLISLSRNFAYTIAKMATATNSSDIMVVPKMRQLRYFHSIPRFSHKIRLGSGAGVTLSQRPANNFSL